MISNQSTVGPMLEEVRVVHGPEPQTDAEVRKIETVRQAQCSSSRARMLESGGLAAALALAGVLALAAVLAFDLAAALALAGVLTLAGVLGCCRSSGSGLRRGLRSPRHRRGWRQAGCCCIPRSLPARSRLLQQR